MLLWFASNLFSLRIILSGAELFRGYHAAQELRLGSRESEARGWRVFSLIGSKNYSDIKNDFAVYFDASCGILKTPANQAIEKDTKLEALLFISANDDDFSMQRNCTSPAALIACCALRLILHNCLSRLVDVPDVVLHTSCLHHGLTCSTLRKHCACNKLRKSVEIHRGTILIMQVDIRRGWSAAQGLKLEVASESYPSRHRGLLNEETSDSLQ